MKLNDFMKEKIPVVEIFTSISGEGITAGEVVTFIRTAGCNLRCSYCDTTYSYDEFSDENQLLTPVEILDRITEIGVKEIICTGGEPLEIGKSKRYLPLYLADKGFKVRIETNGSCPVYNKTEIINFTGDNKIPNLFYVLDIKSPSSGMSRFNIFEDNLRKLRKGDELKFVVGDSNDIDYALKVIEKYKNLLANGEVIINFSPVFNRIEAGEIVEMLKRHYSYFIQNGLKVRLSLQIHKFIWPPEKRGV
ncbi:radical SAM protein [Fervidicella metallireducens AeB]|uniref:7-carboxy-7-deazaguanine synthase n=1 Tax=Fervidicella metallireducens AeB TaxID=1403537 RepID=A0A017RTB2_9CLOT|nr:radical SAM protein [Fervidicella metallireducens]EYE87851.1 radical SAM protein [Fervidicella metallireducens AeB]